MEIEKELSALKGENLRLNADLEVWDRHIEELKNASPIAADISEIDGLKEELFALRLHYAEDEAKLKDSQLKEAELKTKVEKL